MPEQIIMQKLTELDAAYSGKITDLYTMVNKLNDEVALKGAADDETKNALDKISRELLALQQNDARFSASEIVRMTAGAMFASMVQNPRSLRQIADQKNGAERYEFKNALTGLDVLVRNDWQGLKMEPEQTIFARDLLSVTTTTSDTIEYARMTNYTNAAAPVPEGELKPESSMTFADVTAKVIVIAHWVPVTKQKIDDIPYLQAVLENLLIYFLKLAEDAQILFGSGVGENMEGLFTVAPAFNAALMANVQLKQMADVVRKAVLQTVRASKIRPDTVIISPESGADMELLKDTNGNYLRVYSGGVVWRLRVVESPSITDDSFLVGNFKAGATLFDREQSSVTVGWQNDDFVRNKLTMLAEQREGLVVWFPNAFTQGKFSTALA